MFKQHYNDYFQDIKLTASCGHETSFHNIISEDRVVLLSMFYSTCQIKCIPSGRIFARANKLLGPLCEQENIHFCMITLNPQDNLDDMNLFKDIISHPLAADKLRNFTLYTGAAPGIEHLRKAFGMWIEDDLVRDREISEHIAKYVLINNHLGHVRHITPFRNPIDIARYAIQWSSKHLGPQTWYLLIKEFRWHMVTEDELYENVSTISERYTIPFLPQEIKEKVVFHGSLQKGRMTPLKNDKNRIWPTLNIPHTCQCEAPSNIPPRCDEQ